MTSVRASERVVVIGAGPAGLSLAAALERAGLSALVLERGPGAADSWRRMPTHMPLNSPWGASVLPGTRTAWWRWGRVPSRAGYHDYLLGFARDARLRIETGVVVEKVEPLSGGGYRLITNVGDYQTRSLVNATGYFRKPFVPHLPGAGASSIRQLTVPDYRDPQTLRDRLGPDRRRVLIVGARITAGQIAQELFDAGFEVTLSHRSPLSFGWAASIQRLGFRLYYPWEHWRLRNPAYAKRDSRLPMAGGRMRWLILRGRIATRPALRALDGDSAVFADDRRERFDALLWAAGYRPALDHLAALVRLDPESGLPALLGHESAEAPGLFFLGLDQQTDFTSRMLRGIRRDSQELSAQLPGLPPP